MFELCRNNYYNSNIVHGMRTRYIYVRIVDDKFEDKFHSRPLNPVVGFISRFGAEMKLQQQTGFN